MIRARTTPQLKQQAEKIISKLGLSVSDAINAFYSQIVVHKGMPFNLWLEAGHKPKYYTKIKDDKHLKKLIGLKD